MDWTDSFESLKAQPLLEHLSEHAVVVASGDALSYIEDHPSEPWNRPQDNPTFTVILHQNVTDKTRWSCYNHEIIMGEHYLKSGNATYTLPQWYKHTKDYLKQVWAVRLPAKDVPAMTKLVNEFPEQMQTILVDGKKLPIKKPFDPFEL